MRPARGRSAAVAAAAAISGSSAKRTCVVRLEKVVQQPNRNEADDDRKKMTGPLKKRPVPVAMKKTPPGGRQTRRRGGAEEDLSEYMLVTARAKRTPKPNPKYSNDEIVKPRVRSRENIDDSGAEADETYQSAPEDYVPPDETSEDDFAPRSMRGVIHLANGEITKRRRGRPPKSARTEVVITPKQQQQQQQPQQPQKRKLDFVSASKDLETILAQNKRLNIELYDASDSDVSTTTPKRRAVRSSTAQQTSAQRPVSRLALKQPSPPQKPAPAPQQAQLKRFPPERRRVQPAPPARPPVVNTSDEDEDDDYDSPPATASTIDDFETMPTFTIVNINDIINKKGDVMIEQTNPKTNTSFTSIQNSQRDDSQTSPTQSARNRRKTMHTTILSDKIDPEKLKNPPARTQFPPRKSIVSHNQLANTLSKSLLNNSQAFNSSPRILNNVLCRRTKALQAQQEHLEEQKQQHQQQHHQPKFQQQLPVRNVDSPSEPKIQSKENHFNNFRSTAMSAAAAAAATTTTTTPTLPTAATSGIQKTLATPPAAAAPNRKLPLSKVVVQRQGNKIIKKITCFETWYVINLPVATDTLAQKQKFEMSLMHLANNLKEVEMPTTDWSYKVNLQRINRNSLAKLSEVFTGEVQDSNISEADKHNYQPVSVMFRRASHNPKLKMPYDRAVIFKNQSYYTNIDGKNIRLVGSPLTIGAQSEIEILLQLIDEVSLQSPLVEQITYVL